MVKALKNNKGTTMVMYVTAISVLIGCASISVDIGHIMLKKAELVKAADAAALAAAQELVNNEDNALAIARDYLEKNGVKQEEADIVMLEDGNGISILANREVNYFFARILGQEKGKVEARAVAKVLPVVSVTGGLRPFAIEQQTLVYGQKYTLKEGAGDGNSGNYGSLALGGTGTSNYRDNILYGYGGRVSVGDLIDTEPGNMSNPTKSSVDNLIRQCDHSPKCTFDSFQPDCPRIVTVVIVESLDVNGRAPVKVYGFASFFIEGVAGQGNRSELAGYFVKTLTQGELAETQTDFGLKGVKLVK
ncbi:MAG: pilus assembly protein TadG-related protein [Bacillota bacterium]